MLPARAPETGERVARDIMPARDRDLADRIGHVGDRHGDETFGGGMRIERQFGEARRDRNGVERLIAVRAEQSGEEVGAQLPQHDVAVGDGERPAAAVAGRPRHGPGTFRPDQQPLPVEAANRPATRRDGMDAQHRCADAGTRDQRLGIALISPGIMRHVGRGAAHVEPDDAL